MSINQYSFVSNGDRFPANMNFKQLGFLPRHIQDDLQNTAEYQIKSKVKKENLTLFINCFLNESSEQVFKPENISDFYNLSKEFEKDDLTDRIEREFSDLLRISFLTSATTTKGDISDSEEYIAEHLDAFLSMHRSDMYNFQLSTLYNIFFHQKRLLRDENLAYKFITENPRNDSNLFVLLGSLDSKNLNEESLRDSIAKKDDHLKFAPQIDFGFFEKLSQKVSSLESAMSKMEQKMKGAEEIISGLIQKAPNAGTIRVSGISKF